jgi:hypothetical protein
MTDDPTYADQHGWLWLMCGGCCLGFQLLTYMASTAASEVYKAALSTRCPPLTTPCTARPLHSRPDITSRHTWGGAWALKQCCFKTDLSVAVATCLQTLDAYVAILQQRHGLYVQQVQQLDVLPVTAPLPVVASVLSDRRWSICQGCQQV